MKRLFPLIAFIIFAFPPGCVEDNSFTPPVLSMGLVINEVFSTGEPDWIELYNVGTTTLDLTGYQIYDAGSVNNKFTLLDLTIAPGGFLTLFCDDVGSGVHTNFRLSSQGETVWLEESDGQFIDLMDFPALSAGHSYGRRPDGTGTPVVLTRPTQGATNTPHNAPPAITDVTRTPLFPSPTDTVQIAASVSDESGVQAVTLHYAVDSGGFSDVDMIHFNGTWYAGRIPRVPESGTVRYYVSAEDDSGAVTVLPALAPAMTFSYVSSLTAYTPPRLYIKEFLTSNSATIQDPDFGAFADWIEIYNAEAHAVDMSGMSLTDDLSDPVKWPIPDGVTIPAGGFIVFWADDADTLLTTPHTNFRLSRNNEAIGLFDREIVNHIQIDTYTYGSMDTDVSLGRFPDGASTFQTFTEPTPGGPNSVRYLCAGHSDIS